jgi:hypothetical protein
MENLRSGSSRTSRNVVLVPPKEGYCFKSDKIAWSWVFGLSLLSFNVAEFHPKLENGIQEVDVFKFQGKIAINSRMVSMREPTKVKKQQVFNTPSIGVIKYFRWFR